MARDERSYHGSVALDPEPVLSTPKTSPRPMSGLEWSMMIALSAVWGGSFFFNHIAVAELPVFTVVVGRVAIAALLLLAVMALQGERLPSDRRVWAAFSGMGLLNNAIPFSLIVAGQQTLASGAASILNASTPLFGVLFAHVLTVDEKMNGHRLMGVVIGFAGVAEMVGFDALIGGHFAAELMCLGAAISYALAGLFGRRFRTMGVTPIATATGQTIASSAMMLPFMLVVDRPWTLAAPSYSAIAALIGVAAISTALAYVLYFRILETAGATNLLLVTFLVPVSAIWLGALFLNESLSLKQILGMALIGLGLAVLDGRPWRALFSSRATRAGSPRTR